MEEQTRNQYNHFSDEKHPSMNLKDIAQIQTLQLPVV